jgi:hypothetical protein
MAFSIYLLNYLMMRGEIRKPKPGHFHWQPGLVKEGKGVGTWPVSW